MTQHTFEFRQRISDQFKAFHSQNPSIYAELVSLAREVKAAGNRHYGIGALFEVLRYNKRITSTGDCFKLNNNYRSHYARLIEKQEPDLAGFFEKRGLRAA